MSTRYSGDARRSFIIGSRLCPPAITRAPAPSRPSVAMAPSTVVARSYSNGPGVCTERPFLGWQVATNAGLLGRLVLHRRVSPDHRRARHPLGARLADLRIQHPGRQASGGRVAQCRPVRAGSRDRGLASKPRECERALRVDLRDPRRLDVAAALEVAQACRAGPRIETVDQ